MLDTAHVHFLNECLRFIFLTYMLYFDEAEVKQFFDKFRQLSQPKEKQDPSC